MVDLIDVDGVEWNEGNQMKNWISYPVSTYECEEFFFNLPLLIEDDTKHSQIEARHYALGQTNGEKLLFLVFTVRNKKIRVISARDMNRKERAVYGKATS